MHHDDDGYDWNEGHPDHEGVMAASQLHRLAKMSKMLLAIIGENDELEGWVQYKISRAYNDLSDVFTYVQFKAQGTWVEEDYPAYEGSQEEPEEFVGDDEDYIEVDDDFEEEYEEEYDEDEEEYEEELEDYEGKLGLEKEGLEEAKKKKKSGKRGFWDNMWDKRRRGEPPAKTQKQGRPDPKTWEKLTNK